MKNKLYNRIIKTALFSSPLMALYGVTPVYLFINIPIRIMAFAGFGLLINVLFFWLINIVIIKYTYTDSSVLRRYFYSYLTNLVAHLIFMLLRSFLVTNVALEEEFIIKSVTPNTFFAYPIISVLAINTIILIICNSILLAEKKEIVEVEIEQLKVTNLEAQKKVLLQQLQPHFLFNTLSILKSLIRENPTEAENYSIKLSEFLRYTIEVNNQNVVTVEEELKFTKDYLALQIVRFEDSLKCSIHLPQNILKEKIPAYALQTLVENAIKHNSFTEKKPLHISIEYKQNSICIGNNKTSLKSNTSLGTGLQNLNNRYKLINGFQIQIKNEEAIFEVCVPLIGNS